MRKITSILISLIFILFLSNNIVLYSIINSDRETVIISRVIDGDTVELTDGRIIRLANINSPEKNSALSIQSSTFMRKYLNKTVEVEILTKDKYGRFVARIYAPEYVNSELVSLGLASKFLVYDSDLKSFSKEENAAINNQRGIWKHSRYWGCFKMNVNAEKEIVTINNLCNVSLKGFYIKDESRKTYKFLNIDSPYIELRTGDGQDNQNILYWASSSNIWNNDRDSAYLFDSKDMVASYYSYGY